MIEHWSSSLGTALSSKFAITESADLMRVQALAFGTPIRKPLNAMNITTSTCATVIEKFSQSFG